ncbi:MAG: methionine--tRNA ligase subunit beta [Candidatus Nealsonbacteria bacterium]|nr:MAG: methionine--tRNA ligase subunit beta [Candidatus Nealsonbacteria bacterium]
MKMENINFEEFQKIELKVAKVIQAERIEESEKLLKLQIDLGGEKRQIVAGVAKFYQPENLVGKEIVVVANLEPRMIFGLESQGMLLAADVNGKPVLLKPDEKVPPGTKIR